MKKLIIILLCTFFLLGCTGKAKETSKEEVKVETPIVKDLELLSFEVEYKSDRDDSLQFVFAQMELDNQQEGIFILNQKISASENFTTHKYQMFEDYIVLIAQLKLGNTPKKMVINKVAIKYSDNEVIVFGEDLDKYFAFNTYIDFDSKTKTITTKKVQGKHLPHMTLKRGFINKLFELE